ARAPPAPASTAGPPTAARSSSGPSTTTNAPAATASGTAPSPGETHEPAPTTTNAKQDPRPNRQDTPGGFPNQGGDMIKVTATRGLCALAIAAAGLAATATPAAADTSLKPTPPSWHTCNPAGTGTIRHP